MVAGVKRGEDVLNFALAYDLLIANTLFRKRESHLVTFRSGQHSGQIDFICNDPDRENGKDLLYMLSKPHLLNNSLALSSSLRAKGCNRSY